MDVLCMFLGDVVIVLFFGGEKCCVVLVKFLL